MTELERPEKKIPAPRHTVHTRIRCVQPVKRSENRVTQNDMND